MITLQQAARKAQGGRYFLEVDGDRDVLTVYSSRTGRAVNCVSIREEEPVSVVLGLAMGLIVSLLLWGVILTLWGAI